MTTGDIKNNLSNLERDLTRINYPDPLNQEKAKEGDPTVFLPILHFVLTEYSPLVSNFIREEGYRLLAKSDYRFIELSFNLMTNKLNRKPALSVNQFFSQGFAEKKLIMCSEIIRAVRGKHVQLVNKAKVKAPQPARKFGTAREPEIEDSKSEIPVKVRVERMEPMLPPQPLINKENVHTNEPEADIAILEEPRVGCTKKAPEPVQLIREERNPMFQQLFQMFGQLSNAMMSTTKMVNLLQQQQEELKQKHDQEKETLHNEIILLKNRVAFLENNQRPTSVVSSVQRETRVEYKPQLQETFQTMNIVNAEPEQTTEDFISQIKAKFENTKSYLAELQQSRS